MNFKESEKYKELIEITKQGNEGCLKLLNDLLKTHHESIFKKTVAMSILNGLIIQIIGAIEKTHHQKMQTLNKLYDLCVKEFMEEFMGEK